MDCSFLDQAIDNLQLFIAEQPILAIVVAVALWKWLKSGNRRG